MSQLDKTPHTPNISDQFIDVRDWPWFVQKVLEITVEAYKNFRQKHKIRLEWEEDTFTANLIDNIWHVIRKHKLQNWL